jgi:hypothetical protein
MCFNGLLQKILNEVLPNDGLKCTALSTFAKKNCGCAGEQWNYFKCKSEN